MRVWRLASCLVLVVASVGSFAAAVRVDAAPLAADTTSLGGPTTPVLSARRAPALLVEPIARRRLQAALDALVAKAPPSSCLTVASGGESLYSWNADVPLVPASVEKLATAIAALEVMGPDATFTTLAAAAAPPDGGAIDGDLWLVGGGDPILSSDPYIAHFRRQPQIHTDFEALADAIVAAGVQQVTGSVVGDESRYDGERYVDIWPQRYIADDETGRLSALSLDDTFFQFPPNPDVFVPPTEPAPDPALFAAAQLTAALEARGVDITGEPASGVAPPDPERVPVAVVSSPALRDVLAQMLTESDNTTAELLTKEIGLRRGQGGSTEGGTAAIASVLAEIGLPVTGVRVADGSGLAVENQQTCGAVQAMLDRAGPTSVLAGGLAVAGESGTLYRRFLDTPVAGRMRAKTGSLRQSIGLAGFVDTLPGSTLSFSFIVNRTGNERINEDDVALQDELAHILVDYPNAPTIDDVGPLPVVPSEG